MKRLIALLLSLSMLFTFIPCTAYAGGYNGWDSAHTYYFIDGEMQKNNIIYVPEESGYYSLDIYGRAKVGWIRDDYGSWHYGDPEKNGMFAMGWKKIGGKWYYFNEDYRGYMLSDTVVLIDGKTYCFGSDGAMMTGWVEQTFYDYDEETGEYIEDYSQLIYADANGVVVRSSWRKIDGEWYYFDETCAMQTGWQRISKKWYYFDEDGVMQTGWQKISGKQYFFKSSGAMAANEWVKGYYWVNKDGTWTYKYKASWKKSGSKWWFGDTSGWYAKNTTITIDGNKYTFDKRGYMV